jgi:FkbM family methyltransferase
MKLFERLARGSARRFGFDLVGLGPDYLLGRRGADRFERAKALTGFQLWHDLKFLLKQFEINCVLDVGANTGQFALGLRRAGYEGHIISFEPVGAAYARLRAAAERDPAWSVLNFALGSANCEATINVTSNSDLSSLLTPNPYSQERFGKKMELVGTEEVTVRRLDSVLYDVAGHVARPRFYLKMDTQGYDLETFAGLGESADLMLGLQSEVSTLPIYHEMPPLTEAVRVYEARGFEIAGMYPVGWDKPTGRVLEFDCVMVRPGAAGRAARP